MPGHPRRFAGQRARTPAALLRKRVLRLLAGPPVTGRDLARALEETAGPTRALRLLLKDLVREGAVELLAAGPCRGYRLAGRADP